MSSPNTSLASGLMLAALAAFGIFASYYVQFQWLSAFDFLPSASILFLPAGVKLLAMIIGRSWGVLGLLCGDLINEYVVNQAPLSMEVYVVQPLLWVLVPYVVLQYMMKQNTIAKNLENLTFYHVVILAVVSSFANALVYQLHMSLAHEATASVLQAIWAMTVGDIGGIIACLAAVVALKRLLMAKQDESAEGDAPSA